MNKQIAIKSGVGIAALIAGAMLLLPALAGAGDPQAPPAVTVLREQGGRVSWCHAKDRIAFDAAGADGDFEVYTMTPGGEEVRCLTAAVSALPEQGHRGNPQWHPSGEWLVYQAEDPTLGGLPPGKVGRFVASPGIALNNNLWITEGEGERHWRITQVPRRGGVLHPHFSPDGQKLLWSEVSYPSRSQIGHWVLKLADFRVVEGEPRVENVRILQPGNLQLYEAHGFSPIENTIIFSAVPPGGYYFDFEIYTYAWESGELTQLTDDDEWDEHAHYSPNGTKIVWTSTAGTPQTKGTNWLHTAKHPPRLEYWEMNPDGSEKRRLSGFNHPNSANWWGLPGGTGIGDFAWGPRGERLVAKFRRGKGSEMTAMVELKKLEP